MTSLATSTTAATPVQTLPADWTPTAPGCRRTGDYWVWLYSEGKDERTVLGGPSQITDCLAPTWAPELTYAGSQCPPGFTPACDVEAVTCCPT